MKNIQVAKVSRLHPPFPYILFYVKSINQHRNVHLTPSMTVHEVDPYVVTSTQRQTVLGGSGGAYESFAYDARNRMLPTFYVTHDSSDGAMVRFTPNPSVVQEAERTKEYSKVLTTMGTLEWLVLAPSGNSESAFSGTFEWSTNRGFADSNSSKFYRNSEGIDIRDGILYFTTKVSKSLYILDLDLRTYTRSSTEKGKHLSHKPNNEGVRASIICCISAQPHSLHLYSCSRKVLSMANQIKYSVF